jgi:CBS domain-containing protein
MSLIDILDRDVITAAPETAVGDITAAMRDHDVSVVAILREGRPVGLLTDADIGRAFIAGERLDGKTAADLLAGAPLTIRATADLSTLVAELAEEDARRAMVTDDRGNFEGIVTLEGALVQYGEDLERILRLFDSE